MNFSHFLQEHPERSINALKEDNSSEQVINTMCSVRVAFCSFLSFKFLTQDTSTLLSHQFFQTESPCYNKRLNLKWWEFSWVGWILASVVYSTVKVQVYDLLISSTCTAYRIVSPTAYSTRGIRKSRFGQWVRPGRVSS